MKLGVLVILLGVFAVAPAAAQDHAVEAFSVSLACFGTARGSVVDTSSAAFSDDDGDSVTGNINTTRRTSYAAALRIRISGEAGDIRVPPRMLPALRGRRDAEGAFKLTNVRVAEKLITGQFTFNFMNKPKFVIDRTTGVIEMTALGGGFSGTCEPVSEEPEARKF